MKQKGEQRIDLAKNLHSTDPNIWFHNLFALGPELLFGKNESKLD